MRHDVGWNALFHGLSILLWPHPLVWRVRITHADACDAVADAVAAAFIEDANLYARTLALLTLRATSLRRYYRAIDGANRAAAADRSRSAASVSARLRGSRATLPWSSRPLGTILLGGLGLKRSIATPPPAAHAQAPGPPRPRETPQNEPLRG